MIIEIEFEVEIEILSMGIWFVYYAYLAHQIVIILLSR